MMTGSIKLVVAIFQALFIGLVQTLGSDAYLRLDSHARAARVDMVHSITRPLDALAMLTSNLTAGSMPIQMSFERPLEPSRSYDEFAYQATGCYRSDSWPWWLQGASTDQSLPLVPLFLLLLALWSGQGLSSKRQLKETGLMILTGCAASGASKLLGSIGGALAVSVLANVYGAYLGGFAYGAAVPGLLFLVPTGLTAVGGLAENYQGSDVDQFANGLNTGFGMVLGETLTEFSAFAPRTDGSKVGIQLAMGLLLGSTLVYIPELMSGRAKKAQDDL